MGYPTVTTCDDGSVQANLYFTVADNVGFSGKSYRDRLIIGIKEAIDHLGLSNSQHWKIGFLKSTDTDIIPFVGGPNILGIHEADFLDGLKDYDPEKLKNDVPLVLKISVALDPVSDNQHCKALLSCLSSESIFIMSPSEAKNIQSFIVQASQDTPPVPAMEVRSDAGVPKLGKA